MIPTRFYNSFRMKVFILLFLLLGIFTMNGCKTTSSTAKQKKATFHEICFYPAALPSTATAQDIESAANIFAQNAMEKGVRVIDSFIINNNACFFLSRSKLSFPINYQEKISREASYIISSTFSPSTISRYTIRLGRTAVARDSYSLDAKLPLLSTPEKGIRIIASPRKLLRFFRKMKKLSYDVQIGILPNGEVALQSKTASVAPSLLMLWKSPEISLEKAVPGEYAIAAVATPIEQESITIFEPEWSLQKLPTAFNETEAKFIFSTGTLNSPWNGELVLRFLYSLAYSHLQAHSEDILFSPQLLGETPRVSATLLSSEILFPLISNMSPEKTFCWLKNITQEPTHLPSAFYANLLSLKMARKIFTGSDLFLGGKTLLGPATTLDFTKMKQYFFRQDGIYGEISGEMKLYMYDGDLLFESTMISDEQPKPFKAYFGKKSSDTHQLIISFVAVGTESPLTINAIEKKIETSNKIEIIQQLHEELSESRGWASLSLLIHPSQEKKIVALYEEVAKKLQKNSIYLGVYRVNKEKQEE